MKKLILICGLLASGLSFAAKPNNTTTWQERKQSCEGGAVIAETVMAARQRGVSIREIYTLMSTFDKETRTIFEIFVNNAYDVPLAPTKGDADIAVLEFSDQFFKECMEDK